MYDNIIKYMPRHIYIHTYYRRQVECPFSWNTTWPDHTWPPMHIYVAGKYIICASFTNYTLRSYCCFYYCIRWLTAYVAFTARVVITFSRIRKLIVANWLLCHTGARKVMRRRSAYYTPSGRVESNYSRPGCSIFSSDIIWHGSFMRRHIIMHRISLE